MILSRLLPWVCFSYTCDALWGARLRGPVRHADRALVGGEWAVFQFQIRAQLYSNPNTLDALSPGQPPKPLSNQYKKLAPMGGRGTGGTRQEENEKEEEARRGFICDRNRMKKEQEEDFVQTS
jgi:hypothetical protein